MATTHFSPGRETVMTHAERTMVINQIAEELAKNLNLIRDTDSKAYQRSSLSLIRTAIIDAMGVGEIDGMNRVQKIYQDSRAKVSG